MNDDEAERTAEKREYNLAVMVVKRNWANCLTVIENYWQEKVDAATNAERERLAKYAQGFFIESMGQVLTPAHWETFKQQLEGEN